MMPQFINNTDELISALSYIVMNKNDLPNQLKNYVEILGLYVQGAIMPMDFGSHEWVAAGGEFVQYFSAVCSGPPWGKDNESLSCTVTGDFSNWKINKFDQNTWNKRFAHLVEPTFEIAFYLSDEDEYLHTRLSNVVNHFKTSGEWLGLYNKRCLSCNQPISFWDYFNSKPCPTCNGKARE